VDIHLLPLKRGKKLKELDAYILANRGVHAKSLAEDKNVSERYILNRQRKFGVRLLTTGNPNGRGGKPREKQAD
jgi:hypothetical protein